MAKKNADGSNVVPVSVGLRPVNLEKPEGNNIEVEGLPEEWKSVEALGGFAPSPKWEKPGEAVFGTYVGMRSGVGTNSSRVYEIMAHVAKDKEPELVAVWGTSALDRAIDSAYPPVKSGDKIGIVYLGGKPAKRGPLPVKLFQVMIKRPGDTTQTVKPTEKKEPVNVTPTK